MRILKYLLLILLLLFIGAAVFVSTQSADFKVVRTKIIKLSRSTVYNYVNDFNNWESFFALNSSSKKYTFSINTIGKGAFIDWNTLSESGKIQNKLVVENSIITQNKILNGANSTSVWNFKDTLGGTKVTLKNNGIVDFKTKVLSYLTGGVSKEIGDQMELDLENLNNTLNYIINITTIY